MKLNVKDGKVKFLLKTGSDFVENVMSESEAQKMIDKGEVTFSAHGGYEICVDGKWYFDGKFEEETPVETSAEEQGDTPALAPATDNGFTPHFGKRGKR